MGPLDGGKVPIGICDWLDSVVASWAVPRSAMDILILRGLAKGSLRGEVYAISEMADHMSYSRDLRALFEVLGPKNGGPGGPPTI